MGHSGIQTSRFLSSQKLVGFQHGVSRQSGISAFERWRFFFPSGMGHLNIEALGIGHKVLVIRCWEPSGVEAIGKLKAFGHLCIWVWRGMT